MSGHDGYDEGSSAALEGRCFAPRADTELEYPPFAEFCESYPQSAELCELASFGREYPETYGWFYPGEGGEYDRGKLSSPRRASSQRLAMTEDYDAAGRSGNTAFRPGLEQSLHGSASRIRPPAPPRPLTMVLIGPNFQIGGVRQHALSLARFLDPQRIRITGFVATDPLPKENQDHGLPAPLVYGDGPTLDRVSREADILLMWGGGFSQRLKRLSALRVYVAHGESGWTRSGLEESAGVVDHVIAVSQRVRQRVCQGFPTTTILNGVDASRLATTAPRNEFRRRFAFRPGDFVVGTVGRFTKEKRHPMLIDAVSLLPERFKLLIVGSGRRRAELCDYANQRIPGRFAIATAHEHLGDYYGAMDAFALVSSQEGFGLVLAEAMMCGRPVISTNVGCVPEVLSDRVSGLIVGPQPRFVAAATALLDEHPQWARGIAAQGRDFAARHLHASRMARQYEDLLLSLVERFRPQASEA